tara:strand:- start:314 stop:1123 length:810 start_codon:yes stop_codon:yes gene_type:complete
MDTKDDKEIFCMEITNGYVFRQIFEFYNQLVVNKIPMFLKENGVTIQTSISTPKDGKKLMSDVEIFTDDIINYRINTDLTTIKREDSDTPCQIEKINMINIKSVLKSVSKQNSVKIYKNVGSDNIDLQIRGANIDNTKIITSKYESSYFNLEDFEDINHDPNMKIDISQFCVTMKGLLRDSSTASFKFYNNGLSIEGKSENNESVKYNYWGKIEGDYKECCVGLSFIKALCKINSLSSHSIVKLFCHKDGFMKITHKIADFGEHNIYIS